ncbi:hypothetical protein EV102420_11_00340 [Pseudescherichia vulneris NBRC 102420]|uniref:Uncharacterized protein n=1 Tax=Pseudescherichia vulneris NBRC 102420 TaxID=1115515 RepID=A0A090V5C8_PSEVU|nr:hypothetical protein [Pseudescherichia vulneris]GAL58464.1 hypothetical protein EV102420_11_00340 [Pseudescherichia vulneris NBRC 102420]STQ60544.1 Uncharacterised protein [Pseudescherichia vulneris]
MKNKDSFDNIATLIASSEIKSKDGFVVIKLASPCNNNEKTNLQSSISQIGYLKPDNLFEGDSEIWLDKRASCWDEGDCPFYNNLESLWQRVNNSEKLPGYFYIVSEKLSHLNVSSNKTLLTFNIYFTWKKILQELSDHFANDFYVFFLMNDKGGDKIEIESTLHFLQLPSFSAPTNELNIALSLVQKIDFDDLHKSERCSVMRATLYELTKSMEKDANKLKLLIQLTTAFNKKYSELYEIYTKRYSVNKLLNELDEKSLEFTSKINEFISSSQTKALTIPGALIAVGALAKVDAPLEAIIITSGLWMIKKVNTSSNDVYREAFTALNNRLDNAFKKYLKFHNELEVKQSASVIQKELEVLIKNSCERLKTIDKLASLMFWGGLIYLFIKLSNSHFHQQIMHFFDKALTASLSYLAPYIAP